MQSKPIARAAAALLAAATMCSAAAPRRGRMRAVIVEKGPPIDGVGEAGTWAQCPPLPLGDCTGAGPGPAKTTARVLFDARRLYVAWQCAESDTDSLARSAARRDGDVWQDDCVELFVTGDPREGYFHFIVNPRGTLYDARRTAASKTYDASYNPAVEVKAAVRKGKGWSVTLAVPLKDVGAYVGEGQTWIANLNRTRPARGGRPMGEWSWAVMGTNDYHQTGDYGQITGVTVPKRADGVVRGATPAAPPPTYNQGVKAGSVTVYRRAADMEIRDAGQGLAKTIDLKIRGSRGLKVAFVARGERDGRPGDFGRTDSGAPVTWRVCFNMFDRRAGDNTTSKAYRALVPGRWQPMLYYCDRFRYNARAESTVAGTADYTNIRFHGRAPGGKGTLSLRDFCIYRGEDTTPPPSPAGLRAAADADGVHLSWKRGTDNVGVALYVISRAGKDGEFRKIAESCVPKYLDHPPAAGTFRYRVLAVDFQDNLSSWSAEAAARSPRPFAQAQPGIQAADRVGYAARVRRIHAAGAGRVVKGRVLCFGDSLTGATSYPRGVEAALGRYVVVGRGYASMRTSFGRKRIEQELAEVNPEFCLILYGTNNSKAARAIPPAMEDLKAIADACEKHGTVPVIGTIPPRGFKDAKSEPEGRYNAALIEMCRRERIPIAYCFEEFQASGDRRNLLARDGVHTHSEGFSTFGRAWRKTMDHVLFVKRGQIPLFAPEGRTPSPRRREQGGNTASAGSLWPPEGESVKVKITRDNWTATVEDEKFGNNGGSSRLKLKGQQEHVLFDIDAAALKGKLITGAMWHVRTASPKAPLLRVTVSSVAAPWVEGTASGYRRQEGSSCFVQAELGKRDWTYPGSTLMDAAFGKGHTIWRFAEASGPDAAGWQSVAVDADVVAARVAGLSHGFGAYDDVGSIWSYRGGKFTYTYFPNRYIHSRESRGSAPWLEVWTSGTDEQAPGIVRDVAAETADLPAGEALVTWTTPKDTGGGKTLGFHVQYAAGGKSGAIPRYLIPMAGKAGEKVRMHIHDLPFAPGESIALAISAVDSAGNVGAVVTKSIRLSGSPRTFPIRPTELKPFAPSKLLPAVGGLKVAVVDLVDKIHPGTGRMIPEQPAGYKGGNHIFSAARKLIRLHAARNEAVCFQVNLEGKADKVDVALRFGAEEALKAAVSRLDYVATGAGPLGDVVVPLAETFAVPFADDPQAAGARNVSLLCEVYVPHKTAPGRKSGQLTIRSGGESLALAVDLTVWDFTLPNKLSFVPEMNAYGTVKPTGNLAYYRLAHEHRLCMNRLYYPWRGTPSMAPKWTGEKLDFTQWDQWFGPLFDGSAFADLPRAREPVDVFYLHFNENWPADVYRAYRKNYWADQAFTPDYRQTLKKAFADMAAHCDQKKWHDTIFEFYLNNKVYYKRDGWRRSAAPWIFDEPVNTQDFWALRWYGVLWHEAVDPVRGRAKMWYRGDVSRTNCGRDLFWGVMDLECLGGSNAQKVRMKHDEQVLWSRSYFTEYGSANDPAGANLQPVLWCLKAWSDGAIGVLPWQTIGSQANLAKGSRTGLFIPHGGGIVPSVRLKCFRRGQQDTEYLTLLGDAYRQPPYAVAGGMRRMVDTRGEVHKTYEADAGTIRFARTSPTALWRLRTSVAAMVSAKRPPYRRCVRPMPSPETDMSRLPDVGYVRAAPKLPPSAPEMD